MKKPVNYVTLNKAINLPSIAAPKSDKTVIFVKLSRYSTNCSLADTLAVTPLYILAVL